MHKITANELPSLADYEHKRSVLRSETMALKKHRYLPIGDHVSLLFENRATIFYQVMEMLRIERTTDDAGIADELAAYNPLIPDGSNWKATMLIEYADKQERHVQLKNLRGIEDRVWVQVGDSERLFAIADEDMEREDQEKTSSVHFLRFELPAEIAAAAKSGAPIQFGIDHPYYNLGTDILSEEVRTALVGDLD